MTRKQQEWIQGALDRYTEKSTSSAAEARKALVREGIYLENGELAPNYRDASEAA